MELRRALLVGIVVSAAAACSSDTPPGQTFYERNIQPILLQTCAGTTSGCHKANVGDDFKFAAGNFDVTSFENVQKRRDVLQPFGPYNYPLLLIKAVGPNQLQVQYGDKFLPIQVQHVGGQLIEVTSDAFFTLQNWLDNGATENGLKPPTPPQTGDGTCSTAVPAGFVAATFTSNPGFQVFVDTVQPVLDKHGCTAGSCHGAPQSDFYITCGTDDNQKAFNFSQAWSFVNSPVSDSQILRIPLAVAAGGRGHTGGDQFASTTDPDYLALSSWAAGVGVLPFATDAGRAFFKDNVQPVLVQKGCSFQACHSPEATNDFKLRSGTPQGFYGAVALEKNYELLRDFFMAVEFPDARRGRAVAKTILEDDPREATTQGGIKHRGGSVLESPGDGPSDPALCPQPWTPTSTPFCTIQNWLTIERSTAGLPAMASGDTLPIVYVSRTTAAPADRLSFDTFQGGADLRVAQATLGAAQAIASVDVAGSTSLIAGCNLGASPDVQAPDVENDGKTVAFAARATAADPLEVYTVGIDGANCKQVTPTEPDVGALKIHNFDPAWAPDGSGLLVFASTRGKAAAAPFLSRKRFLPQSDLWRIDPANPTTTLEQMTFLSNSEISPQFMREGRVIMTTEKASDGFYQLSGRRLNWDLTDYHPLLGQRHNSPYADPTGDLTQTKPSIGFDAATDIREANDGDFILILSDVGSDGTPVLAGGAGALAIFNRSIGPFEQGRTDAGYLKSVRVLDPLGGASGDSAATAGYRAPFYLPDGRLLVSYTTSPSAPTWSVVVVDPRFNTQTTLIPNACDAVVAYPYPDRSMFLNRRQLVFGGNADLGDDGHAILHMPDAPLVMTLLTGNLRRGRPVDAFGKATKLRILTEAPCGMMCSGNTMSGVFDTETEIGTADLASDGSVRVQLPSRTGLVFELIDDKGTSIAKMTEEHQLGPGEQMSMGVSQPLFNGVCGGCHGSVSGVELDIAVTADVLTGASQSLSLGNAPQKVGN